MKDGKKITNARKINKMRFIAGISLCAIVIVLTGVGLALNFADFYQDHTPTSGIGTLRMFTTLSNLLAAIAAWLCLPFQIDGLRRDKYNLPNWIVFILYVGAVGVFLTFFVAITLISATQGFVITMFEKSNIFFHTLNPIFITLLFVLIISDEHVKFRWSFLALAPVAIYSFVYFIMVFVAKQWGDHYQTNAYIPWPVSLLAVLLVAFGVTQLLRFLHNLTHKYVTVNLERYYLESEDYAFPAIKDAIAHLAEVEAKFYQKGDDIYIPIDIISLLSKRYGSPLPEDIEYDMYLENYLMHIHPNGKQG